MFVFIKSSKFAVNQQTIMTYLNEFHKITIERCLKEIAASKSLELNYSTELNRAQQMHKEIAQRYPNEPYFLL